MKSLALLVTALTLCVLLAEAVSKRFWKHFFEALKGRDAVFATSPTPGLKTELGKNLNVLFRNKPFHTNSWGFRGKEFSYEKPPSTFRIVGLGDSVMMGWGVADDETYLSLLEKKLNIRNKPPVVEVMNLAVAGYNTVQEYIVLKERGLALKPDLLILGYTGNDQEPNDSCVGSPLLLFSSPFLNLATLGLFRKTTLKRLLCERETIKKLFAHLPPNFETAYTQIGKIAQENKIPLLTVLDSRYVGSPLRHSQIEQLSQSLGIKTLNLFELYRDLPETIGIGEANAIHDDHNKKYLLGIGPGHDTHPNAEWHKRTADEVYAYLKQTHLLPPR